MNKLEYFNCVANIILLLLVIGLYWKIIHLNKCLLVLSKNIFTFAKMSLKNDDEVKELITEVRNEHETE